MSIVNEMRYKKRPRSLPGAIAMRSWRSGRQRTESACGRWGVNAMHRQRKGVVLLLVGLFIQFPPTNGHAELVAQEPRSRVPLVDVTLVTVVTQIAIVSANRDDPKWRDEHHHFEDGFTSAPVSTLAGLVAFVAVLPFTPGSV